MKYYLFLTLFWVVSVWATESSAEVLESEVSFPRLQKISSDLYYTQDESSWLYIVVERVQDTNINAWRKYTEVQTAKEAKGYYRGERLSEGADFFKKVLSEYFYSRNRLWIAYVTESQPSATLPNNAFWDYSVYQIRDYEHAIAGKIKMFVSVITDTNAEITSHVGIAASVESLFSGRPRNLSMALHSFAAKVMLTINPSLRYMVNAPVGKMAEILQKALPAGAVRSGIIRKQPEESMDFGGFSEKTPLLHKCLRDYYAWVAQSALCSWNVRHLRYKDGEMPQPSEGFPSYLRYDEELGFSMIEESLAAYLDVSCENDMRSEFCQNQTTEINFFDASALGTPVLQIDYPRGIKNWFKIFDPSGEIYGFTVMEHSWLQYTVFQPFGDTQYCVTDIGALARLHL